MGQVLLNHGKGISLSVARLPREKSSTLLTVDIKDLACS